MVEVKVNDNNTYEMSELLLDTMDDDYSYTEEIESQLCIPQDPIEDILELFPSFNNQLISSSDLLFEVQEFEENIEKNKFEEESINVANKKRCYADPMLGEANKKQRSKRVAKQYADKEKRKCTHCQTEKTPLWRIGPLGPKTLCNACGVRYKSGRLLPEYRPASSPTFNVSRHSNFHKKILLKRKTNLLGSFY